MRDALGRAKFHPETAARTDVPGVAPVSPSPGTGGDVLMIEDDPAMDGEPGADVTGQLGDVMKESAQIALSYVRAHADELGVDARRRHAAAPPARARGRGAEGRSVGRHHDDHRAGRLLTGRPVRPEVGMTGEVTLQGRVLPIGGVKQKVLAAQRAGLTDGDPARAQRARPRRRARGGARRA